MFVSEHLRCSVYYKKKEGGHMKIGEMGMEM
jgi:hypothetical protein